MRDVVDARLLLLVLDLAVEIGGHALEFGDHRLDLSDLTTLLVDLEPLEPDQGVSGLHDAI